MFYLADSTEDLSLGHSLSGSSVGLLQRGKGEAKIYRRLQQRSDCAFLFSKYSWCSDVTFSTRISKVPGSPKASRREQWWLWCTTHWHCLRHRACHRLSPPPRSVPPGYFLHPSGHIFAFTSAYQISPLAEPEMFFSNWTLITSRTL